MGKPAVGTKFDMASLFDGAKLYKNGGGQADASVLKDKVVGLYFSAHWCPPCRNFTPLLKDFYNELDGEAFEIVFVSLDRSADDLKKYLDEAHGEWYYLAQGDAKIQELSTKFGVSGIPALIIVKADGTLVTKDGRSVVQSKPPKQALAAWKA